MIIEFLKSYLLYSVVGFAGAWFDWEYRCLSCPSQHSVFDTDIVTVMVGDEHSPETMPPMPNGSCACIFRLSKVTLEILNYYVFAPLNAFNGNYDTIGRYSVAELLFKLYKMGKNVQLIVTSGTEFIEGGPVSFTESAQVCFSQFLGREQPMEGMVSLLMFPAPLLLRSKIQSRDTDEEPLAAVMADIKVEATHTAIEANTHDITRRMAGMLVQRDRTYSVFREVYTPSKVQESIREITDFHIKRRIEHNHNSRHAKISLKEVMSKKRGIRACEVRMMEDKTPNPAYLCEYSVAIHANLLGRGKLELSQEDKASLQTLRRVSIKYYAQLSNVLSNGEAYTRAIHSYYLYLGNMQKGEFLCVHPTKHQKVQIFDNAELMRSHWQSCHGIEQGEILLPFVMPALIKEHEPALERMAAVGTGNPGQVGPPGGHTGPGADAKLAGDTGTSNTKPKGTAGTRVESGKRSDKTHRGGNRSTTTGRGMAHYVRKRPPTTKI